MSEKLGRRTMLGSIGAMLAAGLAYVFPSRVAAKEDVREKLNSIGRPLKLVGTHPVFPQPFIGDSYVAWAAEERNKVGRKLAASINEYATAVDAVVPLRDSPIRDSPTPVYAPSTIDAFWCGKHEAVAARLPHSLAEIVDELRHGQQHSLFVQQHLLQSVLTELVGTSDFTTVRTAEEMVPLASKLAGRNIGARMRAPVIDVDLDRLLMAKDERRLAWSLWAAAKTLRRRVDDCEAAALASLGDAAPQYVRHARCLPLDVWLNRTHVNRVEIHLSWWFGGLYLPSDVDPQFPLAKPLNEL